MRRLIALNLVMVCIVLTFVGGCNSAAGASRPHRQTFHNAALVMPGEMSVNPHESTHDSRADEGAFIDSAAAATFGRNDHLLGADGNDRVASIEFLHVRQRDYLRTINGRPREFSTIFISSTKRGIVN